MARKENTDKYGKSWSQDIIKAVWEKADAFNPYPISERRKDKCGKMIKFDEYGNRNSEYGWEIDHILAVANGGDDDLDNLQPLYWQNNVKKGDRRDWNCS
jgi:hypothetical protein